MAKNNKHKLIIGTKNWGLVGSELKGEASSFHLPQYFIKRLRVALERGDSLETIQRLFRQYQISWDAHKIYILLQTNKL